MFILVYLKQNPIQLLHGRLFGMRQSKATQWIHVLLPVLRNTLRTLGDAPCRSVEALRQQPGGGGTASVPGVVTVGSGPSRHPSSGPPFCHDGTERPIPRPHDCD